MKLFVYKYEIDKFEWFSHDWGNDGRKVVLNTFLLKRTLKDCLIVIILNLEKKNIVVGIKSSKQNSEKPTVLCFVCNYRYVSMATPEKSRGYS